MKSFARYAWLVLAVNVLVVLWGAVVRATVSGAGCGQHWPRCNGEILPSLHDRRTLIEYSHRLTSGVALVMVVVLAVWAWRKRALWPTQNRLALASLVLMLGEALIGAALVLLRLVEMDASLKRAVSMSMHLVNTFLLLGALTMTAASASFDLSPRWRAGRTRTLVVAGVVLLLITGVTGALAALGDTLFPAASLAAGVAADADAGSHVLLRLRMLHPFVAVLSACALAAGTSALTAASAPNAAVERSSRWFLLALFAQLAMGVLNLILLVPLWTQLVHLLLADAVIVTFTITATRALATPQPVEALSTTAAVMPS